MGQEAAWGCTKQTLGRRSVSHALLVLQRVVHSFLCFWGTVMIQFLVFPKLALNLLSSSVRILDPPPPPPKCWNYKHAPSAWPISGFSPLGCFRGQSFWGCLLVHSTLLILQEFKSYCWKEQLSLLCLCASWQWLPWLLLLECGACWWIVLCLNCKESGQFISITHFERILEDKVIAIKADH